MEKKNIIIQEDKKFHLNLFQMMTDIIDVLENHTKYISKIIDAIESLSINQKDFLDISTILNHEMNKMKKEIDDININSIIKEQILKLKN